MLEEANKKLKAVETENAALKLKLAKLVACAAEGGSESTREVRSTWARARA